MINGSTTNRASDGIVKMMLAVVVVMLAAPGMFSMMTLAPVYSVIFCPRSRPMMSVVPPAANPITIVILRLG